VDQILGPPKAPAATIYLTVDPFGLSRKVTTTILTDAPDRRLGARGLSDASRMHGAHIRRYLRALVRSEVVPT
jgi:hypothetical protein